MLQFLYSSLASIVLINGTFKSSAGGEGWGIQCYGPADDMGGRGEGRLRAVSLLLENPRGKSSRARVTRERRSHE